MPTSIPAHPSASVSTSPEYMLGHSNAETRRLMLQHQLFAPVTRRLFEAAEHRAVQMLPLLVGAWTHKEA